jgi:hypothetical protein
MVTLVAVLGIVAGGDDVGVGKMAESSRLRISIV